MGFELRAFLGRHDELLAWEKQLANAIACRLDGELGLVPLTSNLYAELAASFTPEEKKRDFDTRADLAASRWCEKASRGTVVAYVNMGEFGNESHEDAAVWVDGRATLSHVMLEKVFPYFKTNARPAELELHRGETAAEKWEAAARAERAKGRV